MKIDAHQHFWNFDPVRDTWMTEEMEAIRKDFHPPDLEYELNAHGIDGCVAVQADESLAETSYLLNLASDYSFIKGVVGWIDLKAEDIEQKLESFRDEKKLVGFRKILQSLPAEVMDEPSFRRGIQLLAKCSFTYDLLIYPSHLPAAIRLVKDFPNQKFVLDHMAKPYIAIEEIQPWKEHIKLLAELPNVSCKVSGLVTEANWNSWKQADFIPYLDAVVSAFGTKRLMYASDWPVCLLAGSYSEVYHILNTYFEAFSSDEQMAIFGGNAIDFYNLNC